MPTYIYKAGHQSGEIVNGKVQADSIDLAAESLRKQGLSILQLRPIGSGSLNFDTIKDFLQGLGKAELSSSERVMFTSNFSEMLKTGLSIVEAISTFEDEGGSGRSKRMFQEIVTDIKAGRAPSSSFAKFPKTFPPIYTHIMSSGETTGTLAETMSYLAKQLKKDHDLTSKVKGAMTYPVVVIVVMIVVLGFIAFSVLPKITSFAENLGQDLPLATKILIGTNKFIVKNAVFIILGFIGSAIAFIRISATPLGRRVIDRLLLKIPIFGQLAKRYDLARYCRLLGAFYHYGISLPQAFDILSVSLSNYYYQQAAISIKGNIARGVALSDAMDREDRGLFPKIMVRVVRGAERSAGVDESLWRLADYYESELENSLNSMTTIIEPILIIVLGIAIVGIAIAVIVPIYKITTSF